MAYNPDKKSYLITNRGDGKVLELDSNYKLNTVATGLKDPRDLVVGKVGSNKGLLVIDDNTIVVYDATGYNKIISFNISTLSWSEIEDIEMDPRDPQYFYLSDVGAGRIVKGKVGPPPFYTPSYTTLVSSGLNRPRGLLFNDKNELLVVTDDSLAKVVKIDTASGKLTTVFTPGVDSLNSIVQDKEGNYFMSNWDDSYLYRCDKNFKNLTKLTGYNKPAGMVVNAESDLLILLCHFCNKMEFHKLHYVEPNAGAAACPSDSFTVDVSIVADGVGTYNSNNNFQLELSNSQGKFTSGTVIGSLTTQTKPKSIRGKLPEGISGSGYKMRISSTSPRFSSSEKSVTVYDKPDLSTVQKKWSLCKGSTIQIGRSAAANETYHWSKSETLSDSTISNPMFTAADTGQFTWLLTATNKIYGCSSNAEVQIDVNPDIQLKSLERRVGLCFGDSTEIGVTSSPYSFSWSPTSGLTDVKVSNPTFRDTIGRTYYISVEDTATGCKGADSVWVSVYSLPEVSAPNTPYSFCAGSTVNLNVQTPTGVQFAWSPATHLSDTNQQSPVFYSADAGLYQYAVTVTDRNLCQNTTGVTVHNNSIPNGVLDEIGGAGNATEGYEVTIEGRMNGSSYFNLYLGYENGALQFVDSFSSLPVMAYQVDSVFFDRGYLEFVSDSGCKMQSDTIQLFWLSVKNVFVSDFQVYPNPTSTKLFIQSGGTFIQDIKLTDLSGIVIQEQSDLRPRGQFEMSLEGLTSGVYVVYLTDELGLTYQKKIIKID